MKAMLEVVKVDVKDIVTTSTTQDCGQGAVCINQED